MFATPAFAQTAGAAASGDASSFVELEIAPTVKARVVKATLSEVTGTGTAKPAND